MHSTSQPSELTLSSFLPPNITELPKYYWIIVVMSYSCPIWQFEKVDAVERTVVVPAMPLSQVGVLDDRGQLPGTNFSLDIFLCSYTGTQNLLLVFYHTTNWKISNGEKLLSAVMILLFTKKIGSYRWSFLYFFYYSNQSPRDLTSSLSPQN